MNMSQQQQQQQQQHAGAMNLAHSPLASVAAPAAAARPTDTQRELLEARRKFSSMLEGSVLDYLHFSPAALEACVDCMHTLFNNILQHPDDPKYRRIKAANKTYLRCVAGVAHAEGLMLAAGWRSKVVDMERSLVWEHEQDSHDWRVLQAATEVLHKALSTLHMKAEHKRHEDAERKSRHAEERERIRLALEDDRRQRHLTQQLTAARGPAPATVLPAADAGVEGGPHVGHAGDDEHVDAAPGVQ